MKLILSIQRITLILGILFLIIGHSAFAHSHIDQSCAIEQTSESRDIFDILIDLFNKNHNSSDLENFRVKTNCFDNIKFTVADLRVVTLLALFERVLLSLPTPTYVEFLNIFSVLKEILGIEFITGRASPTEIL